MLAPAVQAQIGHVVRPISQPLAVRGPCALDGDGFHDLPLVAAVDGYFIELTAAAVGHFAIGYEQHALAVRTPSGHDVRGRVPGQATGLTALHGDDVDIGVVVIIGRERDPLAIGREVRGELGGGIRGELHGVAAVSLADPDVASVDECQVIL